MPRILRHMTGKGLTRLALLVFTAVLAAGVTLAVIDPTTLLGR